MNETYETFPDDLRLRYFMSARFLHNHERFPALFCHPYTVIAALESGEAEVAFGDKHRPPLRLRAEEVCIIPANITRHTRSLSPNGAKFIAVGYLFEIRGGLDLLSFIEVPFHLNRKAGDGLRDLLEELFLHESTTDSQSQLVRNVSRQRIGYAMLENILPLATAKPEMPSMRRILPAIDTLNKYFAAPPDLPVLIKRARLSRTHFFRMFKSQTGTTPVEFIKRRRLREALLLLKESDLTVAEIGNAIGWSDPFYFSKLFKAAIGMPPSIYRKHQNQPAL